MFAVCLHHVPVWTSLHNKLSSRSVLPLPLIRLSYLHLKDLFSMLCKHKSHYTPLPPQQIPSGLCGTWNKEIYLILSVLLYYFPFFLHCYFFFVCLFASPFFLSRMFQSNIITILVMLFTLITTSYIQYSGHVHECRFLCLYGVRSSFNTSCCVAVTWVSCIWQELMAAQPKRNPSKITRKCQWPHYTHQLTLSTSFAQWLFFFWFSLISKSHVLPVALIIHMKWWERVREVVRWWRGGKRIWSMSLRSQIKPN